MPGILRVLDPSTRVSAVFCQGQLHLVILEGWKTANVAANSCELCPEAAYGEPAESWEPIFIPPTPPNVLSIVSSFYVSIWSAYIPLIPIPNSSLHHDSTPQKWPGQRLCWVSAKRRSKTNNNPKPSRHTSPPKNYPNFVRWIIWNFANISVLSTREIPWWSNRWSNILWWSWVARRSGEA